MHCGSCTELGLSEKTLVRVLLVMRCVDECCSCSITVVCKSSPPRIVSPRPHVPNEVKSLPKRASLTAKEGAGCGDFESHVNHRKLRCRPHSHSAFAIAPTNVVTCVVAWRCEQVIMKELTGQICGSARKRRSGVAPKAWGI